MSRFRRWLAKKLLGYDPAQFKEDIYTCIDGICLEIAELKNTVDKDDGSWKSSIQNAIMNLDKRIDTIKGVVIQHQEQFEEFFTDDEEEVVISFPTDKKDIN